MAYASGSRTGSARGSGRGGPPRRGGSSNATAYAVAAVLVLGAVGLVLALSGGGGDKKKDTPTATATVPTTKPTPTAPPPKAEKPYPPMPPGKAEEARTLVASFAADASRADGYYQESVRAKQAGNDALWQSKLKEAKQLYHGINERWNEFVMTLPTNRDYDQEQVVAHYFPRENGQVATYVKNLRAMKSDEK
jgi:hypothetical protein